MSRHSLISINNSEELVTTFENEMIPLKDLTIKSINLINSRSIMLLTNNGLLFVFGKNRNGELGLGEEIVEVKKFTQINYLKHKIKLIESGHVFNSFIVDELNQIFFTGITYTLSDKEEEKYTFTKITTNEISENIKSIRLAFDVLFVVTESDKLFVRGCNSSGQLGLGHTKPVYNSLIRNSLLQNIKIKDLKCSDSHSIILDEDGIVHFCGQSMDYYFKPLSFLHSKIKSISVTTKFSILLSYYNELIIINNYSNPIDYTVLPTGIELKSTFGNNLWADYSALITKDNKIYTYDSNKFVCDDENTIVDYTRLSDSLLLNTLNLPYLYVCGIDTNSILVLYTDYLISEDYDNKHANSFFTNLLNQFLDYENLFIDIDFVIF